eukprot:TRINITY_DN654_c0_g1_i1.p1 TRINITY_DN654_c0_g1~~TRINITY_DN654_c0_g1_i1.p1  ORF type:complete len:206 (+),score=36.01 TRINITY_DN654_c0_g1_i1:128-745(+)
MRTQANLSVSLLVFLLGAVVVYSALPTYVQTNCVVAFNDFVDYCYNPGTSTSDYGNTTNQFIQPWSCEWNGDDSSSCGRVKLNFTDTDNVSHQSVACNTVGCTITAGGDTGTKQWLQQYTVGTQVNCYYTSAQLATVYVDTSLICNGQGTFVPSNNTCSCNSAYAGDGCTDFIQPPYTPPPNSGYQTSAPLVLILSLLVLIAAMN